MEKRKLLTPSGLELRPLGLPARSQSLYRLRYPSFSYTDRGLVYSAKASIFIRDKTIFSSERMLHKDYYRKNSVAKISLAVIVKGLGTKTKWLAVPPVIK
jgi:hypothetical protein